MLTERLKERLVVAGVPWEVSRVDLREIIALCKKFLTNPMAG